MLYAIPSFRKMDGFRCVRSGESVVQFRISLAVFPLFRAIAWPSVRYLEESKYRSVQSDDVAQRCIAKPWREKTQQE